ncbi:MAG: ribose 5-phosphate isomerase B [Candidatus Zixiibacteriota bacterium]|jgi:RpiB/LacA/LacB family sugar-phosphate isomerase
MRIAFASDHRGFPLKEYLKAAAAELGHEAVDFGTDCEDSCDYVDFGRAAAEAVARGEVERGVLVCGTGVGMSLVGNKVPGVRASLCWTVHMARLTRAHNDSNVIVFSGDQTGLRYAREMFVAWLETPFEGGRHGRRVDKIKAIEADYAK